MPPGASRIGANCRSIQHSVNGRTVVGRFDEKDGTMFKAPWFKTPWFKTPWLLLLGLLASLPGPAAAQADYPNRPARIVVPSTPGGGTDMFARLIAQHLSVALGQQFIVDNRPGGGTLIGMDAVAHAPPDG